MQNHTHILVVISGHGYGHLAMTAPVINLMTQRHPNIKLSIRTSLPESLIKSKVAAPFTYINKPCDFGLVMNSAFDIDIASSFERYRGLHDQWPQAIQEEQRFLKSLEVDLLISNIAYLPLIAAKQLGIPSIAMCCLNWADIFEYYFMDQPHAALIHQQIINAYQSADLFIRPQPAMPMPHFTTTAVGPLAILGDNVKEKILQTLSLPAHTQLILVSMGGIETQFNSANWPTIRDSHYITAHRETPLGRSDITSLYDLPFSFSQALRSCDLFLTKPGYGSFAEAARYGVPVLYVNRDNWPEQPYLTQWLGQYTLTQCITYDAFMSGNFMTEAESLLAKEAHFSPPVAGEEEVYKLATKHLHL